MPRKKHQEPRETEAVARAETVRITPVDIQQKEFGLAFRGYNERDVDQFLDEVTEEVARLYAENKRLREDLEFAKTSRLDLGGAEEAEALLRQAREDAARLLEEARARAATIDGAPVPAGRATAAALAPFVSQEREFLQSLANLIQTHAEAVKDQIRQARDVAAHAAARDVAAHAAAREAAAREEAARAALQEEEAARAAFRASADEERGEPATEGSTDRSPEAAASGPPTEPWMPPQAEGSESEEWMDYYVSAQTEDGPGVQGGSSDEILDLTESSDQARPPHEERAADEDERGGPDRRQLEPHRAVREPEAAEDDAAPDRSIRELFWGEDY